MAPLPTRSRASLRLRGRLVYKSRARRVPSPQWLPVLFPSVWSCCLARNPCGREDGVYQPVSTSARSRLVEGGRGPRARRLRGCRAGQGAQEMRAAAAASAGRPDKGASQWRGCQGRRWGCRAVGVPAPGSSIAISPGLHPVRAPGSAAPSLSPFAEIANVCFSFLYCSFFFLRLFFHLRLGQPEGP